MNVRLAFLLIVLYASDLALTIVGLRLGFVEGHAPSMVVLAALGIPGLIAMKGVMVGIQLGVVSWMPRLKRVGWAMILGMAAVPVVYNVTMLL